MISAYLRHYDQNLINNIICESYFSKLKIDCFYSKPQHDCALVFFFSDSHWKGIISLNEWFSHTFPQSGGLSKAQWDMNLVEELFFTSKYPLQTNNIGLDYSQLTQLPITDNIHLEVMPTLNTANGKLWIIEVSSTEMIKESLLIDSFIIQKIPFNISILLGCSSISLKLLKRLNIGDVLLINNMCQIATLNSLYIGEYSREAEGFLIYKNSNHNISKKTTITDGGLNNMTDSLINRKIPVSISFVLQQSVITLSELESFYQGQILPCQLNVEKNILIQANGLTIAYGELIWIDDCPGVIIQRMEDLNAC